MTRQRIYLIGFILLVSATVLILVIGGYRTNDAINQMEIYGVIDSIKVGDHQSYFFKVRRKWFGFGYHSAKLSQELAVGDSLVKPLNTVHITVYKNKSILADSVWHYTFD